jgi:hypothetical protein
MSWSFKFSAGTVHIGDAYLAKNIAQDNLKELKLEKVGTTFHPNDGMFYLVVAMAGIVSEVTVKAKWIAVEAAGVKDQLIDESHYVTDNSSPFYLDLSLPRPWPIGKYKVEIILEEKIARTIEFAVVPE